MKCKLEFHTIQYFKSKVKTLQKTKYIYIKEWFLIYSIRWLIQINDKLESRKIYVIISFKGFK